MPWRPANVEKLTNHAAKPATSPFHSAISQNSRGLLPNSASATSASVARTSCRSFSYSASSRTSATTRPASSGRARRIVSVIVRSHRDFGLDMRVWVVTFEFEVLVAEAENVLHIGIDLYRRQRPRRTRQLQPRLIEMIGIELGVAERVHEVARLQSRHLRHHHGEQRVGGDVEGHAEEHVAGTLVELARQFAVRD